MLNGNCLHWRLDRSLTPILPCQMPPLPMGPVHGLTGPHFFDAKIFPSAGPLCCITTSCSNCIWAHYQLLVVHWLSSPWTSSPGNGTFPNSCPMHLTLSASCFPPVTCAEVPACFAPSVSDFRESFMSICVLPGGTGRTYERTQVTPAILNSNHLFRCKWDISAPRSHRREQTPKIQSWRDSVSNRPLCLMTTK